MSQSAASRRYFAAIISLPRWVAIGLILLIGTLPPWLVWQLKDEALHQSLHTEAAAQAALLTRAIARNPGVWMYARERLQYAVFDLSNTNRQLRLINTSGEVLFELGPTQDAPWRHERQPVFEYGKQVGTLEVSASLRPLQRTVLLTSLGSAALALLTIVPLYLRLLRSMREAALRLRGSEERFRLFFDRARDGILLVAPDSGTLLEFNDTACQRLGYSRNDFARLRLPRLVCREEAHSLNEQLCRARAQGWVRFETRLRSKSGLPLPVELTLQFLPVESHPRLYVTFHDLSLRKRAEEALREREEILSTIIDQAGAAIELLDTETQQLVEFNDVGPQTLGYSREEYAALDPLELQATFTREEALARASLLPFGVTANNEIQLRHRHGQLLDVQTSTTAILLHERKHLVNVWRDITAQKRIQHEIEQLNNELELRVRERTAALQMAEERLRLLIETSPDAILTLSGPEWHFNSCNPAAMEMFAIAPGTDISTLSPRQLAPPQQPDGQDSLPLLQGHLRRCLELGHYHFEWVCRRQDNSEFYSAIQLAHFTLHGETVLVATVRDISRQKLAETALAQMNRHLSQQVEDKVEELRRKDHLLIQQSRLAAMGEMVHNIAHQWRQPLNSLGLIMQNLQLDFADGLLTPEQMRGQSAKAMHLIHGMSHTIDDFRNFFRPDVDACDFPIAEAVREALSIAEASLRHHHINLVQTLDDSLQLYGHPNQFAQVVLNLLENAKDAIRERQINEGRITIRLYAQEGEAVLEIGDNGGGIPPDLLPRIFDPYFTTKEQGSGIGLYMSKVIIETHLGGQLHVHSDALGSCFTLYLPLLPVSGTESSSDQPQF